MTLPVHLRLIALCGAVGLLVAGIPAAAGPVRLGGETMGTGWSVSVVADAPLDYGRLRAVIEAEFDDVVAGMSTWETDSTISRFNDLQEPGWHRIDPRFVTVVAAARMLAEATGGAFDPTVGPLVERWGFGAKGAAATLPDAVEIAALQRSSGWHRLRIDPQRRRLWQPGGLRLDLSAIAKGFAVDQVARALHASGLRDHLVEIGGELRASGQRGDGRPWQVAIAAGNPDDSALRVELQDLAIATSGDGERWQRDNGRRYSHLIDPRSGRPVQHEPVAVSVIHDECMQADGLATALAVMGPVEGLGYALQHGLAVRFVWRRNGALEHRSTPAFDRHLSPPR